MKIDETTLNNLKRWAEGKKKTESSYSGYWTGYVKALNDVLALMKE